MTEFNAGLYQTVPDGRSVPYEILGSDMQVLSLSMPPGTKVSAEKGAMMMMDPAYKSSVNCEQPCGRYCAGEQCAFDQFTNGGDETAVIGLTPNFPAKVIPLHMHGDLKYRAKDGAFFAYIGNTKLSYSFNSIGNCCCSGQGCINQSIEGTGEGEGIAFIAAMGTIMTKTLAEGEKIVVDTESVLAWESTARLGVRPAGGCCGCCCGGEGMFNTTLEGPGTVYFQSMSYNRFKRAMAVQVTKQSASEGRTAAE